MCARRLACPLCSQPSFLTLDALRTGLVSVATRPLMCPVCSEVLLGIDKLTIHLFGHSITSNNKIQEEPKSNDICSNNNLNHTNINTLNAAHLQNWDLPIVQCITQSKTINKKGDENFKNVLNTSNAGTFANLHTYFNDHISDNKILNKKVLENEESITLCKMHDSNNIISEGKKVLPESEGSKISLCGASSNSNDSDNNDLKVSDMKQSNATQCLPIWMENFPEVYSNPTPSCTRDALIVTQSQNSEDKSDTPIEIQENAQSDSSCKENTLLDFHTLCSTLPSYLENMSTTKVEDKHKLPPAKESIPDLNVLKDNDQTEHRMQILPQRESFKDLHAKEKTEHCNICGLYVLNYNILTLHKQLVHKVDEKDLNVPTEDLKSYPCHLCSKVFKMRGSLMVHMRVAHTGYDLELEPKNGETLLALNSSGYNCPTCGKNFRKEQHVMQHLKTHDGKQWECDVCSKMFTTKYFLKKHKRLHSGEMPYKCNVCEKTFTFQQSYHKHRLYHRADKPHMCATCGRSFKELSTLHNHERIHTGEKPFACESCGKCFRQRVSYLVHRRIHTGVMPYKCTLCGKSFRYKVSQRTHKCSAQSTDNIAPNISNNNTKKVKLVINIPKDNTKVSNLQEINVPLQLQKGCNMVKKEENKFVLIINTHGQHILTKESDIQHSEFQEEDSTKHMEINENNVYKNIWNSNKPCNSKQPTETILEKSSNCNQSENMKDFFSLVMSPQQNEMVLPASEMEHLRLSSPIQKGIFIDTYRNSKPMSNDMQINVNNVPLEGTFNSNHDITNSLQTINEESFKQLLYDFDKKE